MTLLVGHLYQEWLGWVASAEELAWWTQDIITWCALEEAIEVFFNSLEYLSMPRPLADHVTVVYRALLAREPDAGGLGWWVDDLAGQLTALEDDVMVSPEFEVRVDRLFPQPEAVHRPTRDERPRPYGRSRLQVWTKSGPFFGESLAYLGRVALGSQKETKQGETSTGACTRQSNRPATNANLTRSVQSTCWKHPLGGVPGGMRLCEDAISCALPVGSS
jgi:hypothetical protein